MLRPPAFPTTDVYLRTRHDPDFWGPWVVEILERHNIPTQGVAAGHNATHPTFVGDEVVVKVFGGSPFWRKSHQAELASLRTVALDPSIFAPHIVGVGQLFDDPAEPWPYIITTRTAGIPLWQSGLSTREQVTIAESLGDQIRRVHALPHTNAPDLIHWGIMDVPCSAANSSFPKHLLDQVEAFVAETSMTGTVFVHGDLVSNHIYVTANCLSGVIDWGDGVVADPHYELGKLFVHGFNGERRLFDAFLDAYGWKPVPDFARRTLAHGLKRQAVGLAQHHGFDLFHNLPEILPESQTIGTIAELADRLFEA